jgi:hypothetical protein
MFSGKKVLSIKAFTPAAESEHKLYLVDIVTSEDEAFYQVFPQYIEAFNYASNVLHSAPPGLKINVDITEIDR